MQPSDRKPSRVLLWLLELGVVLAAIRRLRTKPTGPPGIDPASVAVGYERSDMRPGMVILSAAALALLELASALYGAFLLGSLSVTLAETSQRDRVTSG